MNIIIVGAGVAGFSAAENARKNSEDANIILFNAEPHSPYFRPRLPEIVSLKITADQIQAHTDSWYKEKNLEFRKGENVVEICLNNNQVRGSLGSRLRYDRLLIATGAVPFIPEISGSKGGTLEGIYPLRTLDDAIKLKFAADNAQSALLLGSGLLGLELAHALTQRGLTIHVLEKADRILPLQTTPKSALLLQKLLSDIGFVFHLRSELLEVRGQDKVEKALLKTGEELKVDFVAVATGVRSEVTLAKELNLKVDRGIVVDQYMETTIPDIYAAGDCAQTPDGKGGQWPIARLEGLAAGFNLVQADRNNRQPYKPVPPSSFLKVAGIDLLSAGNIDPEGKLKNAEYQTETSYRKVVVNQLGQIAGFTNLGTTVGNQMLTAALGKKAPISDDLLEKLKGEFDFSQFP
ncbi:MAG: FAD-dependent oxidoreductase [Deltaproteobacteria bacterium]|jgi:nitrite reductase (NADH) large subunit|nr:FAD-dependent oxidoreductase [Deltaproteobacteria bacterium]